jgi:hypothetical protein
VPSGEAIVLTASDDTYHTYQAGEQFSVQRQRSNHRTHRRCRDGAFARAQITEILPGSQIAFWQSSITSTVNPG